MNEHGGKEGGRSATGDRRAAGNRHAAGNRAFGAGLTMAVTVGLFAFGGIWVDRKLGTKPWFLLLMVGMGIAGGMLHLIRVVAPDMWPFDKRVTRDQSTTEQDPPTAGDPTDREPD